MTEQPSVATLYPADDEDFVETPITGVKPSGKSWAIQQQRGWYLYCGDDCPIEPKVGMIARLYPRDNIGRRIRGLFIDGQCCWYRSEADDKDYREIQMYGKDAADWLRRWDAGEGVWSIEMGGPGPGYEQCIHITCAEILRWFIDNNVDATLWDEKDTARSIFDRMEKAVSEVPAVKKLGLSGAQWGAAHNLACQFYRRGPRAVMLDERVKERHIQVCRVFPG
jgi:hypothetical protein